MAVERETGEELTTCAIVTTEANELIKPIHDRMPVILQPQDERVWLDPKEHDPQKVLPLLRPYPPEDMEAFAVSKRSTRRRWMSRHWSSESHRAC